jgi:hypothetical protein
MSLYLSLSAMRNVEIFHATISHAAYQLAEDVGVYNVLWNPSKAGISNAGQMIPALEWALADLDDNRERHLRYGQLTYQALRDTLINLKGYCLTDPDASVDSALEPLSSIQQPSQ